MKKLIDGRLVDLSAAEAETRRQECEHNATESLAHVKRIIIERIDARLSVLQRRAWMAETKSLIEASTSVAAVRGIYDGIEWTSPSDAAPAGSVLVQPAVYDDGWIREQMTSLAEALRHLDQRGFDLVHDVLDRMADVERRVDALERGAEPALPQLPMPILSNGTPAPGDFRAAMERVAAAEQQEADIPPDELPPIETGFEEPQVSKTVVIADHRTIDDSSWGRAEIAYQVAIQAKNGSAIYRGFLVEPALRRNMSVEDLADEIIRQRHETVQRVMSEF